jgi:hypothetical protein
MTFFKFPLEAARWLLLANIVASAWLYGGTRPWTRELIAWLLLANTAVFAFGLLLRLRPPRIPAVPLLAGIFLLITGWFLTWNCKMQFIEFAGVFVNRQHPLPGWPGFLDQSMVTPPMILATGLLGAFTVACDMSANRIWRDRLWATLAATGASIVILGLAQRLTDAPSIFWDLERNLGNTFFAVFRYHANAGAYMNLALPLLAGLAVRSFQQKNAHVGRALWTLAALTTAAAAFVNVSRAANTISAALILLFAIWALAAAFDRRQGTTRAAFLLVPVAVLAGIVVLVFSFGLEKTLARWEYGALKQLAPESGRVQAYRIIIEESLPRTGAFGSGPGTFEAVFETHRAQSHIPLAGRYDFAHSDALQTPMEWGWAGAAAWLAIFGGALLRSLKIAFFEKSVEARALAASCALALCGVMIHSTVDFPFQIASIQLFALCVAGLAWAPRTLKKVRAELN